MTPSSQDSKYPGRHPRVNNTAGLRFNMFGLGDLRRLLGIGGFGLL